MRPFPSKNGCMRYAWYVSKMQELWVDLPGPLALSNCSRNTATKPEISRLAVDISRQGLLPLNPIHYEIVRQLNH